MKKRFATLLAAACAIALSLCLAGCAKKDDKPTYQLVNGGTLTVALSPDSPRLNRLMGKRQRGST